MIIVDQNDNPAEDTGPCVCWGDRAVLHEGHCCFAAGSPEDYAPDKPIPCGHNNPADAGGR